MPEAPVDRALSAEPGAAGSVSGGRGAMPLAVALVGVLGAAMLGAAALKARAADPVPRDDRPVAAAVDGRSLWRAPARLRPGGVVTVAVRNDGPAATAVPLTLAVERLDGGSWEPVGTAALCYEIFACTGRVVAPGDELPVRDRAGTAAAHGVGPAATVRLDGPPGRYRLVADALPSAAHRGPVAEVEIVDTDPAPDDPPPLDPTTPHLAVSPVVAAPGRTTLTAVVAGAPTIEACVDPSSSAPWRLERWSHGAWMAASGPLEASRPDPAARACAVSVEVDAAEPGPHRLVGGSGDRVLQGYVWVD